MFEQIGGVRREAQPKQKTRGNETLKRRFDIAANEAPEGDVRAKLRVVADDLGLLRQLGAVALVPRTA